MNASEAYILSSYKEIAVLNAEHGVTLVQDTTSGIVYVKKILTIYNAEVYRTLKNHPVPGIPEIIEMVEEDDRLIVIEEYIGGQTLRAILDNGNLFPEEEAVRIVEQVCVIVNDLHSADPPIIHRDIKPSNIICTPDGSIRLLDMNAARKVVTGKSEDTQLIGTVGYAAPEQFGFGASTVQTDIYAIGVLLCELMTGVLPKERIPRGRIGRIIRKCTRLDPKDRYKSVRDLLDALAAGHGHGPPLARNQAEILHVQQGHPVAQAAYGFLYNGVRLRAIVPRQQVYGIQYDAHIVGVQRLQHALRPLRGADDVTGHRFDGQQRALLLRAPHQRRDILYKEPQRLLRTDVQLQIGGGGRLGSYHVRADLVHEAQVGAIDFLGL